MFELRDYQQETIDKVYQSIKELDSEANEKAKDLKLLRQK